MISTSPVLYHFVSSEETKSYKEENMWEENQCKEHSCVINIK